jgi:hypothetical protein
MCSNHMGVDISLLLLVRSCVMTKSLFLIVRFWKERLSIRFWKEPPPGFGRSDRQVDEMLDLMLMMDRI